MMTDRFFLYPADHAAKDHCYYLKRHYCYRYEMAYSGRKSFLDILHKESPDEAASSLFGELVAPSGGLAFYVALLYIFLTNVLFSKTRCLMQGTYYNQLAKLLQY